MLANRPEPGPQPFSLRQCVGSAVALVRADAREKGVKIAEVVHERTPDALHGHAARVQEILVRLLSNAVKFTPSGGKIAVLVTSHKAGDVHEVQFAVSDSGIGMTLAQQDRVFAPGDDAGERGLSICMRLAQRMGGHLWVRSHPGRGSTFSFTMQARAVDDAAPGTARGGAVDPGIPHDLAEVHPLRILVAGDNPVNQMVVRLLLARLGYTPDFVGDGREALAAVEKKAYDVLIIDVHMPVLDGFAAARELSFRYPSPYRPRVIGLGPGGSDDDVRKATAAGMDDYVTKPVTLDRVVAALRRCARLEPGPRPMAA